MKRISIHRVRWLQGEGGRFTMRIAAAILLMLLLGHAAYSQSAPPGGPSGQQPIDHGPNTPAANNAFQGGGVILQGAPGAPPPKVEATPQGQKPANAVPPPAPASQ